MARFISFRKSISSPVAMTYFVFQYDHNDQNPHPQKLVHISGTPNCDIDIIEAFCADENIWMVMAKTRFYCSAGGFRKLLDEHFVHPIPFPDYESAVVEFRDGEDLDKDFMWGLIREARISGDESYVHAVSDYAKMNSPRRVKRKAQFITAAPVLEQSKAPATKRGRPPKSTKAATEQSKEPTVVEQIKAPAIDEVAKANELAQGDLGALLAERERFIACLETVVAELRLQIASKDRQVKALMKAFEN